MLFPNCFFRGFEVTRKPAIWNDQTSRFFKILKERQRMGYGRERKKKRKKERKIERKKERKGKYFHSGREVSFKWT